jgi:hypothetical protein
MRISGYDSKSHLLEQVVRDCNVLHLGAVGETCADTATRVRRAVNSVHADLTRLAKSCIGVDYDQASVDSLTEQGIFNNLVCADVRTLDRSDIALPNVDVIVAGDVIEHLSEPGSMLDAARRLAEPHTRIVVTVPNSLGLLIFLRNTMGKAVEGEDHVCSFNVYTLSNLLRRHGWFPESAYTCHQKHATMSRGFRIGRIVLRTFPRWGGTLLIIASSWLSPTSDLNTDP